MTEFEAMARDTAEQTASQVTVEWVEGQQEAILSRGHPDPTRAPYWVLVQESGPWGQQLQQWKDNYRFQQVM